MTVIQRIPKQGDLAVVIPYFNSARSMQRFHAGVEFAQSLQQHPDVWFVETGIVGNNMPSLHLWSPLNHLCMYSRSRLWHKENSVNIAWKYLIAEYGYEKVAWLDMDVQQEEGWYSDWSKALDNYKAVQCFETVSRNFPDAFRTERCGELRRRDRESRIQTQGIGWGYQAAAVEKAGWLYPYDMGGSGDEVAFRATFTNSQQLSDANEWSKEWHKEIKGKDASWLHGRKVSTFEFAPDKRRKYQLWRNVMNLASPLPYLTHAKNGALEWHKKTPDDVIELWRQKFNIYDRRSKTEDLDLDSR